MKKFYILISIITLVFHYSLNSQTFMDKSLFNLSEKKEDTLLPGFKVSSDHDQGKKNNGVRNLKVVTSQIETKKMSSSISEEQKTVVKIYPNPIRNVINFSSDKFELICFLDITGKEVILPQLNDFTFDSSELPNGIYLAKVKVDNAIQNIKIIKK